MAKSLMRKVSSRSDDQAASKVPPPPNSCQVPRCENDATFVMARVASGRGVQHRPASDVMNWDTFGGQTSITMQVGYQFSGWFTRCPECLKRGFERKLAKLREQGEHWYYV